MISCMMLLHARNSALLIGIGDYDTDRTGWAVIHGNNDVILLQNKLESKGFEIFSLIDSQATKANVINALNKLVLKTSTGDIVYVHFSGHGQLIEDLNNDEQEAFDQSFICYDACFSSQYNMSGTAYKGQNHLIDDELFPLLNQLKRTVGATGEVIVVFDSCYSGGADRGEMIDDLNPDSEIEWIDTTRGTSDEFRLNSNAKVFLRKIKKPGNYSTTGGHITIISACESNKRNYECRDKYSGKCYGSLSYCIAKLLEKDINISQWIDFFNDKKYMNFKIFRPSQHPVVERH